MTVENVGPADVIVGPPAARWWCPVCKREIPPGQVALNTHVVKDTPRRLVVHQVLNLLAPNALGVAHD